MSEFSNVNVQKEANIYFGGKVISTSISFQDGSKKTLGVMLKGEYEFNTEQKEIMEIMTGKLQVLLPNKSEWITNKIRTKLNRLLNKPNRVLAFKYSCDLTYFS